MENCNFFTYYEPSSVCKLLYNCTNVDASICSQCFTGEKYCPKYVCSQQGQLCQGNVISDDTLTESEDDCSAKCYYEPECNWYTYDTNINYCLLTSDCNPQPATDSHFIGQKECYQSNGGETNPSKD